MKCTHLVHHVEAVSGGEAVRQLGERAQVEAGVARHSRHGHRPAQQQQAADVVQRWHQHHAVVRLTQRLRREGERGGHMRAVSERSAICYRHQIG